MSKKGNKGTGSGSSGTQSEEPLVASTPESKKEPQKSKPKTEVSTGILKCSNACGFNTRWPKAQALKIKTKRNGKVTEAKEAKQPYLCPMCDANGMSSKLVPFG